MGTSVQHHGLTKLIEGLREGVLKLHAQMEGQGYRVELLPELDGSANFTDGAFKLDVLREMPPEKHPREWMHEQARAELEDWEREQSELFAED